MEKVVRAIANREEIGPDDIPAGFLEVLADEGDSDTLVNFHDIIVAVWRKEACSNK